MKCRFCGLKSETLLEVTMIPLCSACYCRIIEKRIRKTIRTKKLFSKQGKITLCIDGSSGSGLLLSFFSGLIWAKNMKIKVKIPNRSALRQAKPFKFEITGKKYGAEVKPLLMDCIVHSFVEGLFNGRINPGKKNSILEKVEKQQAQKYCTFKKIFYRDIAEKDAVSEFIKNIKKRRSSFNFSAMKFMNSI